MIAIALAIVLILLFSKKGKVEEKGGRWKKLYSSLKLERSVQKKPPSLEEIIEVINKNEDVRRKIKEILKEELKKEIMAEIRLKRKKKMKEIKSEKQEKVEEKKKLELKEIPTVSSTMLK